MIHLRPKVYLDIEGTSPDPATARIVELAVLKVMPDRSEKQWCQRFNPGVPIPAEATAVHGITDADVADCPTFYERGRGVMLAFDGCDLAGYNLTNYDVPLLWEEFYRAGLIWDLSQINIVDVEKIFKKREQRTLGAAVSFYCGREHEGAHGALADALATRDVLMAQLDRYPELKTMQPAELAAYATLDDMKRIDLAGKLVRDKDGVARYNIGKLRGRPVSDDTSFARWMLNKDFSENTKIHVERVLQEIEEQLREQEPVMAAHQKDGMPF